MEHGGEERITKRERKAYRVRVVGQKAADRRSRECTGTQLLKPIDGQKVKDCNHAGQVPGIAAMGRELVDQFFHTLDCSCWSASTYKS